MYEVTRNGETVVLTVASGTMARDRAEYYRGEYPADVFEVYYVCGTERVLVG